MFKSSRCQKCVLTLFFFYKYCNLTGGLRTLSGLTKGSGKTAGLLTRRLLIRLISRGGAGISGAGTGGAGTGGARKGGARAGAARWSSTLTNWFTKILVIIPMMAINKAKKNECLY